MDFPSSSDIINDIINFRKRFGLPDIVSDQQNDDQTQEQAAKMGNNDSNKTEVEVEKSSITSKKVQTWSN